MRLKIYEMKEITNEDKRDIFINKKYLYYKCSRQTKL